MRPAQSAGGLFGNGVVDFGACLAASKDPGCFSGTRLGTQAVGTPPSAPIGLSGTTSGASVTLTWGVPTAGDPVATYIIEAGSAAGATNLASLVTGSTATSFSASGVGAGVYFVRVRARNDGGLSAPSNEIVVTVGAGPCNSLPNAPTGLTSTVSGNSVSLTWAAPAGGCTVASYAIEAGSASGLADLANVNTGSTATTFGASGVASGTYYVRVRARNASGSSGPSNEVTVTVGAPRPPAVNLVLNGSFEAPVVPAASFTSFARGSSGITGWTVVGGIGTSVSVINRLYTSGGFSFPSQDGAQWLDLTGLVVNQVEGVQQTVPTTAGARYLLSFWIGNVGPGYGTTSTVEVDVNGVSAGSFTNSTPATTLRWQQFSFSFTATGTSTTLAFLNKDPAGDNSNGLDNVSLVAE